MITSKADIADRLSILVLKEASGVGCRGEYLAYVQAFMETPLTAEMLQCFCDLIVVNNRIWALEADIRSGREKELGLEEVGRRALAIRDHNKERIRLRNAITSLVGIGYIETKVNHASGD